MCPSPCPLCGEVDSYALPVAGKHYHRCRSCELVWLDGADHLGPSAEKAVYDGHDNQVDDPRYRHFLMRAFGEVLSRVPPPASGLDFGCGPGPALIAMGREAGYQMAGYDKFYADLPDLLTRQYDFITSTEVIEHIADPRAALDVLWGCLKPGGILVLQTQRVLDDDRFKTWRYRHDPTHIVFFAEASFRALAIRWQADVLFPHGDVVVFTKP
ncbi:class I SAM-dependent methyltransferase [Aeromonas salmonicida]|uniref:class I SAM-dependent methyltransferase n=1 Tax=Aeromonas salmonicida TaxID=645 RepID=UPI00073CAA6B|nr:class I SAM-dependent methyltransferase [Aeromonas salmonicida]KTA84513.1 methyltransferase [Aeromonas salmonicida]MDE7525731.1 class I SAM-dependent methyltransferase [Aeromonas salmonicida]MDE7529995.1 class I SAM-dependent methyltransferase [Aeromonas salmonicida]